MHIGSNKNEVPQHLICDQASRSLLRNRLILSGVGFIFLTFAALSVKASDICNRTLQVKQSILRALPNVKDCTSLKESDLKKIFSLDLSNSDLSALQSTDLLGLTNLAYIDLRNNRIDSLPNGLFEDLKKLGRIRLDDNELREIPHGVFSNLPNLELLGLNNNKLTNLPDGTFSNVPNLFDLDLRGNKLDFVSPHAFNDLPALSDLGVNREILLNTFPPEVIAKAKQLRLDGPLPLYPLPIPVLPHGLDGVQMTADSEVTGSGAFPDPAINFQVRASRIFATADQYPPTSFAAYGIVAFKSLATAASEGRYKAICKGFVARIANYRILVRRDVQLSDQMATVWPLRNEGLMDKMNAKVDGSHDIVSQDIICNDIINDIGLDVSQNAIRTAERQTSSQLSGEGPFLLAWSPGNHFYKTDALVLSLDLSDVINTEQATRMFGFWVDEIERNPQLWASGFNIERARLSILLAVDRFGSRVLELFGIPS